MTDFLLTDRHEGVVTLTLNAPETRNALSSPAQWDAIVDACAQLEHDDDVRAVVLTGAGSAFCAGGNVKDFRDRKGLAEGDAMQVRENYRRGIQRIPLALWQLDIPTIAAVNGPAVGAGCDLACMCDLRVAGRSARFAESFVKLGLIPGDGGAWWLQRVVGYQRAALMSLTGDMIDAQTALDWGLVMAVVDDADLLAHAQSVAARIAANPGPAVRMTKRLLREAQTQRLDSILQLAAAYQALTHDSDDHAAAVNAFLSARR
ncbi:crotonase/enoyl-CoA hydratase family protein [Nitrogeniibacter mangrovi]|uniref:Crotonase/enoyl-CoA hydratase family protein n=1 Tax=Nitrogeniibacter mangrovi TaxID=2016596 RepID=A0A6C1B543_9RHOO|nr:crotonase/enoyl-CoA hydratase family protein [Nitrogeniibacter mangrovi]QID17888.1 crotonase/enoyl-CoA hydratase family protein [Nitrogeniibacter mangrovi]